MSQHWKMLVYFLESKTEKVPKEIGKSPKIQFEEWQENWIDFPNWFPYLPSQVHLLARNNCEQFVP